MWSIQELIDLHPGLVTHLKRFEVWNSAKLVAGLALSPPLQAHTVRIEILTDLVLICCKGKDQPTTKNLVEWVKMMSHSSTTTAEDPVEYVFIGCVSTNRGCFRVPMGITSGGDFWTERLLRLISQRMDYPPFAQAVEETYALLSLCDALVERMGLERYHGEESHPGGAIAVPGRTETQQLAEHVFFDSATLSTLGINPRLLTPFILSEEDRTNLPLQRHANSALGRRPLALSSDGLQVLVPGSLCHALQQRLIAGLIDTGLGGWTEMFFQTDCANLFVNLALTRMGIKHLKFKPPAAPEGLPSLYPYFGYFDIGKLVIGLTFCPPLTGVLQDVEGGDALDESATRALTTYIAACAEQLNQIPEFSAGLVLVNLAGMRTTSLGFQHLPAGWHMESSGLQDWILLAANGECSAMKLWRLSQQRARLAAHGTRIMDFAGLANLYSYWRANHYRLLRRDMSRETTLINLGFDFALTIRSEALHRRDAHAAPAHRGADWIQLTRRNTNPFFQDDESVFVYVDGDGARQRKLRGCAEMDATRWWVRHDATTHPEDSLDLAFQLWDCVLNWVGAIARWAELKWAARLPPSIEITINLPDVVKSATLEEEITDLASAELTLEVLPDQAGMVLTLPRGFFIYFREAKNVAEKKIVSAIQAAAARLAGEELSPEMLHHWMGEVVRNDDARYFHLIRSNEIKYFIGGDYRAEPLFIEDEDLGLVHVTLADLIGAPRKGGTIKGLRPCVDLLKDAVLKVWEEIERRLATFEHYSVITSCFSSLLIVDRTVSHWDVTARSMLAMHQDSQAVHDVIKERHSDCSRVSLTNRLLLEVAQYACRDTGVGAFTESDHRELLAYVSVLLELAHHRDAISYGFMKPEVVVYPNGEIGVDEEFYIKVVGQYFTQRGEERTERVAAAYEKFYRQDKPPAGAVELPPHILAFDKIFTLEYGFSALQLFGFMDRMRRFAIEVDKAGGIFTQPELEIFLAEAGFTPEAAASLLERLTLPIRSAWDADLPVRCTKTDAYPWRFRRQLSLLVRPLIGLNTTPRSWFISVHLLDLSIDYLVGNVEDARFPEQFFSSKEMKRYVGDSAHKRGHDFTAEVNAAFQAANLQTSLEIEMSALGAPKHDGLGDVDVLAWDLTRSRVFVVECKCLRPSSTIREVVQRLEDFKGDEKKKDSLGRHLRRVSWLGNNRAALARHTGIPEGKIKLLPYLITNDTMPMQFFKDMNFPVTQVVSFAHLAKIF